MKIFIFAEIIYIQFFIVVFWVADYKFKAKLKRKLKITDQIRMHISYVWCEILNQ